MPAEMGKEFFLITKNQYTDSVMYLFREISPYGFVSEVPENGAEMYMGKAVYDIKRCSRRKFSNVRLLVCLPRTDGEIKKYGSLGWDYPKDFLFVEDYIEWLYSQEFKQVIGNRRLVIWGMGVKGKKFISECKYMDIDYGIDKNLEMAGTEINGVRVYAPEKLQSENKEGIFVVITTDSYLEIQDELKKLGMKEYSHYVSYVKMDFSVCRLIGRAVFHPPITTWECQDPFHIRRLQMNGDVQCCHRPIWIKTAIGNVFWQSVDGIMKSLVYQAIKLSVINRNYVFCHHEQCDMLKGQKKAEQNDRDYAKTQFRVDCADLDDSCNLYCESCRKETKVSQNENKELLLNCFVQNFLPETDILMLAGNGEVFLSKYYKELLDNEKIKQIKGILLLTNGTIIDFHKLEEWSSSVKNNISVTVSVDAASPETYGKVRRGGSFEKLYTNLARLAEMRRRKEIKAFTLAFVIQKKNYHEMIDFVKMAEGLSVDGINFTKIDNWGTYTEDEYRDICMQNEDGTLVWELEQELRKLKELHTDMKLFFYNCYGFRLFLCERLNDMPCETKMNPEIGL